MELLSVCDQLPEFIEYNSKFYGLVIHKNKWDNYEDSWEVYYSKLNKNGFSTVNYVLKSNGFNIQDAVFKMQKAVNILRLEHKDDPKLLIH